MISLMSSKAFAKVPIADHVMAEISDKIFFLLGRSSLEIGKKFERIKNDAEMERVRKIISNIQHFSGHKFRFKNPKIRIIKGNENEPNAYSLGTAIYVTESTLLLLNDKELTAVLAHEMAHSEYGHTIERIVFLMGSPFLHLRNLIFSELNMYSTGEIDQYLENVFKDGQTSQIHKIFENASTKQELQADCLAANWLNKGKKLGLRMDSRDLNGATDKMLGVDMGIVKNLMEADFPPRVRYEAVNSGMHIGRRCDL